MIKKVNFLLFNVEFEDGEVLLFPKEFSNKQVKDAIVNDKLVLTHPEHPPITLKSRGWHEIHPSLITTQTNYFFKKKKGGYEIFGDLNGPFKTLAWFALGNNPNNPKDTRWAR